MGATIASAPKRHQNYLLITLAAAALQADLAPRHYRIPPPGDRPPKAPSAASGRRPVVTGRCASRRPPDEHHHGAEHRLVGTDHRDVGKARVRRPRDAPAALDGHPPHQRRAAGTVRPDRHDAAVGRRPVGTDAREVARRRDDDIAASARPAEARCVAAMPTNQLRTSFAPMTSTRRAPWPPPAGLPEGAAAAPHRRHHGANDMDLQAISGGSRPSLTSRKH